jgi:putative nucleotidyltransferase with HDIG domain
MAEPSAGWTPDHERSFKEVLFRFLEEVHCTKAALYLLKPDGAYQLASQYGFGRRDTLRQFHAGDDPLVRKARELRHAPLAVNDVREFPEIEADLRDAGNRRLLLVPLSGASQVVGFVDARDKGGGRPFEEVDVRQGSIIGSALLGLLQQLDLYGEIGVGDRIQSRPPASVHEPEKVEPPRTVLLDEVGLLAVIEAVVDTVAREAVFAVAVTLANPEQATTLVHSSSDGEAIDTDALTRHQSEVLVHAGLPAPHHSSWRLDVRRVSVASAASRPSLIATAVPLHDLDWSMILSVVSAEGGVPPGPVLDRLCREVAIAREAGELRFSRRALARRLLEPGERSYPELLAHSLAVSRLSWQIAQQLGLDSVDIEDAALAGLLHDVGMRELEYDRLYRHVSPSAEDRRIYRRHATVGERILDGTGLDRIAAAVRHHHERWDGNGYPDQLTAEEIPLLARLVHVAEVYDVLTSSFSYRPALSSRQAIETIASAAGQQFDRDVAEALTQVVG